MFKFSIAYFLEPSTDDNQVKISSAIIHVELRNKGFWFHEIDITLQFEYLSVELTNVRRMFQSVQVLF